jgi:phytoene synthase
MHRVSTFIGSSSYRALSDDALKDEDNAAWVLPLDPDVRRAWLDRIHWIRLVDRLAENERFEPEAARFDAFLEAWQRLVRCGVVDAFGPFADVLTSIRSLWFTRPDGDRGDAPDGAAQPRDRLAERSVEAWNAYLDALADYHAQDLVVRTLAQHDAMLWRLSGRIFQLVPFLTEECWNAAGEFGRLDQFFNNLRDMQEDADRGICYVPEDVLARFGVTRGQILSGRCVGDPAYQRLMGFWLDEHLPTLFARATPFIEAADLHPSLQVMRAWSLRRYARILRVFRAIGLDHRRFPARYWAEVRRDLAEHGAPPSRRHPA